MYSEIGKRIKERRKELNISAVELAEYLGLSKATIHRYENGDITRVKLPIIESIATMLQVNPLWLLDKSEVKNIRQTYDMGKALDELLVGLSSHEEVSYYEVPMTPETKDRVILALQILKSSLK